MQIHRSRRYHTMEKYGITLALTRTHTQWHLLFFAVLIRKHLLPTALSLRFLLINFGLFASVSRSPQCFMHDFVFTLHKFFRRVFRHAFFGGAAYMSNAVCVKTKTNDNTRFINGLFWMFIWMCATHILCMFFLVRDLTAQWNSLEANGLGKWF